MKYSFIIFSACVSISLASCNKEQSEEHLARQYCGSCHAFPDPSLLDKKTWENDVLPAMAFRMGLKSSSISFSMQAVDPFLTKIASPVPMVTDEEWEAIRHYFVSKAPDSLLSPEIKADNILNRFDASVVNKSIIPMVTLIREDTVHQELFIGTRFSQLYTLSHDFIMEDSVMLNSPVSSIKFQGDKDPVLSLMGMMDPNDFSIGEIVTLSRHDHKVTPVIDSLQRPVFVEKVDLNHDTLDDYIVCAFGNYTGALLVYENLGNGQFGKHILYNSPGARKVIVRDVNQDGLDDILVLMTQGDEQVSLLTNAGNFNFRVSTLLRFPPVYGSSYFDLVDFNNDGHFDILYTNGDNADYSRVLKPYHGVRIIMNNGKNEFHETEFLPMQGAFQAYATDFDQDGDIDIAAISFFPDFIKHPEQGFVYFENTGKQFIAHTTSLASTGRWLVMEPVDVDKDGDIDLLLGALDFETQVPASLLALWKKERTSVLLLRNKTIDRTSVTRAN